ncbi:MAG TPA: GGDEF domain-containing protein [Sulfurimonas sp.]|nr:GGDEF domain-containing protein [Sulfurimonas sp.]
MPELLKIKHSVFTQSMHEKYEPIAEITSVDLFNVFVEAISSETNLLGEDKLKGLVYRQFREYGDFDVTMQEAAKSVSDIQKSTKDAIVAIDNKDTVALKKAYEQLKTYQKRIKELEDYIYTDDVTGTYNRKFLVNHELTKEGCFKYDGVLIGLSINNFYHINKDYGHDSGDTVLRYVSKSFEMNLQPMGIKVIRYLGTQFIALAEDSISQKAQDLCIKTVESILKKKFKIQSDKVLEIELEFQKMNFKKEDDFQMVYKGL